MRDIDDLMLEGLLRQTLIAEASTVPVTLAPETLRARWQDRSRRGRRRRLILLGIAAALAIPTAALVAGMLRPPTPPVAETRYQSIIARYDYEAPSAMDVIAVRADGQERLIATLPVGIVPAGYRMNGGVVSETGWIAVALSLPPGITATDEAWALVDLRDPTRKARLIQEAVGLGIMEGTGVWSPDGRFATSLADGSVIVVDPRTGATQRIPSAIDEGGSLHWTTVGSELIAISAIGDKSVWSTTLTRKTVPLGAGHGENLALSVDPGPWGRKLATNGSWLQRCSRLAAAGSCLGLPDGSVVSKDPAGLITVRYKNESRSNVMDARISADGQAAWLLLDTTRDGRSFELVRADAEASAKVMASVPVRAGIQSASFSNLAPDDSLAALVSFAVPDYPGSILIPTDGSTPATYHAGDLAGFITSINADAWPGPAFGPVVEAAPPPAGHVVELMSRDDMLATYSDVGPVVIEGEHEPQPGETGGPQRFVIGTAAFTEGIGFVAMCVGDGTIRIATSIRTMDPWEIECTTGIPIGFPSRRIVINAPVEITVTAEAGTAWRVLITDPPPPEPRPSPTP